MNLPVQSSIRKCAFVLMVFVLASTWLNAATVRGRLVRKTAQGQVPVAGVAVTVFSKQSGRSVKSSSGQDGMFYIPNVPRGAYVLEVWNNPKSPMKFNVNVVEPNTDVPPVLVP